MNWNKILIYTIFSVIISAGFSCLLSLTHVIRKCFLFQDLNVTFASTFCLLFVAHNILPRVFQRMITLAMNVASLWSWSLFSRSCNKNTLLNRKCDKSRKVPLLRIKECTGKVASTRQCCPSYVRIVPSHYSLGLLFKDVARTCLDVMFTRARGSQSIASANTRGFYAPKKVSRLCVELRNNDLG